MRSIRFTISTIGLTGLMTLAGCPPQQETPAVASPQTSFNTRPPAQSQQTPFVPQQSDPVVATIDGLEITQQQLDQPLIDAFGLNMLLKIVELDLAKQQAARLGITITATDVAMEKQRYVDQVFKDDKHIAEMRDDLDQKTREGKKADAANDYKAILDEQQRLLAQLLDNQKLTRAEFDLAIETTTYLRAIVQPAVQSKLTEDNLQESFRSRYGEKVQVRHIACANLQEIAEVKRRLAAGESFMQVAVDLSRNRQTGANGGELQPFSRSTPGLPQAFKDSAFALQKPGDVSEVVVADGAYHLIQLEDRIAPTAVKFEDVKESVRQDLAEALTQASVKQVRAQLGQQAIKDLHIQNQTLAKQFEDKITQRSSEIRDRDEIRRQLKSERSATSTTAPASSAAAASIPAAAATEPAPKAMTAPASTSTSTRP